MIETISEKPTIELVTPKIDEQGIIRVINCAPEWDCDPRLPGCDPTKYCNPNIGNCYPRMGRNEPTIELVTKSSNVGGGWQNPCYPDCLPAKRCRPVSRCAPECYPSMPDYNCGPTQNCSPGR